jgi:type I restriction enzyme, S subunit
LSNQQNGQHTLPDGWRWMRVGDFCEVATGGTPDTGNQDYYGGDIPWLKSGDIKGIYIEDIPIHITESGLANSNAAVFPSGTVMMAMCGQGRTRGTTAVLTFPSACSQSVAALLPNDTVVPEILHFALASLYDDIRRVNGNNQRTNLNLENIRNFFIPVPPKNDQAVIAEMLVKEMSVVDRLRTKAEGQQEAMVTMTSVLLREMFEGEEAKQWARTKIGEVCSVNPGQHILEADYNRNRIGIGYLTGPADFGDTYPSITKWTEKPKAWSMPGDVLVTVKGAGVGKANLAPNERVAIGRQLMAIRPNSEILDQTFLYRVINTHFLWLQSEATGATVPGLAREDIESLELPLPPISVQQSFALKLNTQTSTVAVVQAEVRRQLEAINALPSAILREVFGEFSPPHTF